LPQVVKSQDAAQPEGGQAGTFADITIGLQRLPD
jgi:hypothetical protein